jgi:uncharacterized damage-inducible protein DinB
MAISEPMQVLLQHDAWATGNLIEACRKLSPQQLDQRFAIGCGSLHDTLNHMLGAMQRWGDFLNGITPTVRFEETRHSLDEMQRYLDEFSARLVVAAQSPSDEVLSAERGGRKLSMPRGVVLAHITTHGMHHRAQALNMLRQLGVDPLPASSVMDWALSGGAG